MTAPFQPGDIVRHKSSARCVHLTVKECSTTVDIPVDLPEMLKPKLTAGEYLCSFERCSNGIQIPPMRADNMVKA